MKEEGKEERNETERNEGRREGTIKNVVPVKNAIFDFETSAPGS